MARRLYLLGGLRAEDAGVALPLARGKPQTLLAYLALHPRHAHPREALADLLDPDAPPERARRNFSDTLYRLQKTLGPGWLDITPDTVALQGGDALWVDVWAFERLAASGEPAALQAALDTYAGDLLTGFYDDWVLAERELRRAQYLAVLEKVAAQQEAAGALSPALLTARRLIVADPLHEPGHQTYLRLLGRLRRHGEALAHYEDLCRRLWSELEAEPLPETRAVAQALERERSLPTAPAVVEERTPFVGRLAERAEALAAVEAALAGRGGVLAIEGEAGLGKSRLWREVAAGARWRGATVAYGVASEVPGASPFGPLAEALTALLDGPRAGQLEALLPPEAIAALAPLHPAWGTGTAPAEPPSAQSRQALHAALRLLGDRLARLSALVVGLDNLQWASATVWESVDALAQGLAPAGGLLVVLYRRPEIEQTMGWGYLQAWDRAGRLKTLPLAPLTVDDVAQLVSGRSDTPADELHALSGGSPFLIGEWLADTRLRPQSPELTAARRLAALPPGARAALECAAVAGERLPYRLWAAIADLPPLTLARLSEELTAAQWLQAAPAGYGFVHDLLRAAVYENLEAGRRRALHARAARALAELEPDNIRARAFHFDQAGLAAEAASAYRQAGEQDLARFAFREAQEAFERALALLPPTVTPARVETALALAQACDVTGDRARQRPALDEAQAGAIQLGDDALRLRALLARGRAASVTGPYAEAKANLNDALQLAEQLGDRASATEAELALGISALQQFALGEAQAHYARALALARANGDRVREGRALRGLGIVARDLGAPAESVKRLEEAAALQQALGDRLGETLSRTNLIPAFHDLGAWDRLIETAQAVLPRNEALGNRYSAAFVRHMQGLAAYALGDWAAAQSLFLQAEQDFRAVENPRAAALARNALGLVAEARGEVDEALRLYRVALAEAETPEEAAVAQHDLGTLLLRLGQPTQAAELLEAAVEAWTDPGQQLSRLKSEAVLGLTRLALGERAPAEALASAGWSAFGGGLPTGELPQAWLWNLHRLLSALGRIEPARAVLRAAYAELHRQARAISDAARRRSFFEHVPLNRDIVAAHDQATQAARTVTVTLARREAPLGRALTPAEKVAVRWTVDAPEDAAIAAKATRRQHRLRRLLREAEQQGAAPTDDDLARALAVSRRTILRDMQALASGTRIPPTRRRKP